MSCWTLVGVVGCKTIEMSSCLVVETLAFLSFVAIDSFSLLHLFIISAQVVFRGSHKICGVGTKGNSVCGLECEGLADLAKEGLDLVACMALDSDGLY